VSDFLIAPNGTTYYLEFLTERPTLKPTDKEMIATMIKQVSDPISHFRRLACRAASCDIVVIWPKAVPPFSKSVSMEFAPCDSGATGIFLILSLLEEVAEFPRVLYYL
jgi:hypothetical protein